MPYLGCGNFYIDLIYHIIPIALKLLYPYATLYQTEINDCTVDTGLLLNTTSSKMSSRGREILSRKYDETTISKSVTTQPSTIKAISYSTANNRPSTINQLREMRQSHHCYISWFCDSRPQYSLIIQSYTTSLASFIKQETRIHLRTNLSSLHNTSTLTSWKIFILDGRMSTFESVIYLSLSNLLAGFVIVIQNYIHKYGVLIYHLHIGIT